VLGAQRLAVRAERDEAIVAEAVLDRRVRGEPVLAVGDDELRIVGRLSELDDLAERDALPLLIEP